MCFILKNEINTGFFVLQLVIRIQKTQRVSAAAAGQTHNLVAIGSSLIPATIFLNNLKSTHYEGSKV